MTTKADIMVDVSTCSQPFSPAKDTITRTKALHELISGAGRIAVVPSAEYIIGNLENARE
jgi:hypothetical protein